MTTHQTLTDQLRADWGRLRDRPDLLARVRSWQLPGDAPADLDQVLAEAGFGRAVDDVDADGYLSRMVAKAADDELAARIVLQRILPGLVRIAVRRAASVGGLRAAFDETAGAAWVVIRTFPIDRRPRHVAANLLRDIEYQAFVRQRRLVATAREVSTPHHRLPDTPVPVGDDPLLELIDLLAEGVRAGLATSDREVLGLVVDGRSSAAAAEHLGLPARTWRARKAAATERLRRLVAVEA
jgi:DNA-directed RNA polymerase specialized sigma24 family protein